MKKIYLIHGWGGNNSSEGWFGWLKQESKERNIKFIGFNMPDTHYPTIKNWGGFLEQNIDINNLDEETYFIGHSLGCQTILRYLEILPKDIKIKGVVFVGGPFNLKESAYESEEEKEIARPWLQTPINFDKIKTHTKNFLAIFSDDDFCIPLSDSKIFKQKLNAKIIIKHNEKHFNETKKILEVIEFIEK